MKYELIKFQVPQKFRLPEGVQSVQLILSSHNVKHGNNIPSTELAASYPIYFYYIKYNSMIYLHFFHYTLS